MKRNLVVMLSLGLTSMLVLSSCVTINEPPASPVAPTSDYHAVSLVLEAQESHSFPIYLQNTEILHLLWRVENRQTSVWFHIITPSGQTLGFYEDEGNYAGGTLCDHATTGMTGGITQFSPRQYDWGEGYYTMMLNKDSESPVEVKVEYWIED